jgi:hypothetical protein
MRIWGGLSAAVLVVACGAAEEPPPPAAPSAPSQGAPPRAAPPEHVVGGFAIELEPTLLAPGEETEPCYLFPLEVDGPSRLVGGAHLVVGPGLHHGNITTRLATGTGVRACSEADAHEGVADDVLAGGGFIFASSTQVSGEEWQSLPTGTAYPVRDGLEIVARMHYLNTSSEPLEVAPRYEWFTVEEATVAHVLQPFGFVYSGFEIAPHTTLTVAAECDIPDPMHITLLLPHMHALGTDFGAEYAGGTLDGERFLDSPGYDPERGVQRVYDPAVDLAQGAGLRFSCTWTNTYDETIVEGVGKNEMCMLFGYAWPPEHSMSGLADASGCLAVATAPGG